MEKQDGFQSLTFSKMPEVQVSPSYKASSRARSPAISGGNAEMAVSNISNKDKKMAFRKMVLQDLMDAERKHVRSLQTLLTSQLKQLATLMNEDEYLHLVGNLEEIVYLQTSILQAIETQTKVQIDEQRIGAEFMKIAPQLKIAFEKYCSNHPVAVDVVNKKRALLTKFMENYDKDIMTLIAGLSQPFRHLDKYPTTLQELERNMDESHVDRGDTQRAVSVYRDLVSFCAEIRKQKEMQMDLLAAAPIQAWEGSPIEEHGNIVLMGLGSIVNSNTEKDDRCLVLFQDGTLVFLDVSQTLNAYIFKMQIPLTGTEVRRIDPTESALSNGLEFTGASLTNQIVVQFASSKELEKWLEALQSLDTVHVDEGPLNIISPTVPSMYSTGQGSLSPLLKPQISTLPSPGQAELLKKSSTLPSGIGMSSINQALKSQTQQQIHVNGVTETNGLDATFYRHPVEPKIWSSFSLRPHPPARGILKLQSAKYRRQDDMSSDNEDAQILQVVEAYSSNARSGPNNPRSMFDSPQVLVAEDEKLFVEEMIAGQVVVQEKTLVDTVYALKDHINVLQREMKDMQHRIQREQRARKRLEDVLRRSSVSKDSRLTTPDSGREKEDRDSKASS